jgi:hypothetical protein
VTAYLGPGLFPAVDTITLANVPGPGKWTLLSGPKKFGWDIRKGTGLSGATVVPTGDELVEPVFLVELFDDLQYQAFKLFRAAFLKKPLIGVPGAPTSLALGIDHPELKEMGVTSVVVREINPAVNDGFGLWTSLVKFLQYRKPLPALAKPTAAIPDNGAPVPNAQTASERELQGLQQQFNSRLAK